jgi:hypothetical protein
MTNIARKIVGPCNCALAFTMPMTRDDFLRDLQPGSKNDFIKRFARQKGTGLRPDVLWESYKREVDLALSVADEVTRIGVKTVFNLKLQEFGPLLAGSDVLTLVAHWRPPLIERDDLVDVSSLIFKLKESDGEMESFVRARLSPELKARLANDNDMASPSELFIKLLLKDLNRLLVEETLYREPEQADSGIELQHRPEHRMHLNREVLENCFKGELRGGSRLEFYDGLYSINEIIEQIPFAYSGLLDLTVCNSILLGEAIKRQRPRCLMLVNQKPATLDFRLIFYKYVMKELDRQNNAYLDVVMRLRKHIFK